MIKNIRIEDLDPFYQAISNLIGVDNTLKLADEFKGEKVYFPRRVVPVSIRNERLFQEYTGYNSRQLSKKYDLGQRSVEMIVKDMKDKMEAKDNE